MATKLDQVENELRKLTDQNLNLLESGNFADAEIVCDGRTWKVHKLILRSRCPWFDKAFSNNWKEAQTGRIHLEDEKPDQIGELLKFIYAGRHISTVLPHVGVISNAVLAENVLLWRTAEFFLLPDLKEAIRKYLIFRLANVLSFFNNFRFYVNSGDAVHNKQVDDKDTLSNFWLDLSQAVTEIYKSPGARELQKFFATFFCGIREHLPAHVMWDLMKCVPEFQQDVSTALIALHFPHATNQPVSDGLKSLHASEFLKSQQARPTDPGISFKCSKCGKQCPKVGKATSSSGEGYDMILDPFPLGTHKWCAACGSQSIRSLLRAMVSEWPADAPGSG